MGMRHKPTIIKKRQGTLRKCRTHPNEPIPKTGVPTAPAWLDDVAKLEWERAGQILEDQGLISELDVAAFSGYCTAVSDLIRCEQIIQQKGLLAKIGKRPLKHPAFEMKHTALKTIRSFLIEFGMSPSSRARVTANPKKIEVEDLVSEYLQ